MKTLAPLSSLWMPVTKVTLVSVIALGLVNAQGAPNDAVPGPSGSADTGRRWQNAAAQASGARPHKHRRK